MAHWAEFDAGAVNLNWPRCSLFSRLGLTSLLASGNFWGAASGGGWPTSEQVSHPQPGPSPEWIRGKELPAAGQWAWLPCGERITCPQEGEGPITQSHSPAINTGKQGHSINSMSLSLLLGPSSHESVNQERKIIQFRGRNIRGQQSNPKSFSEGSFNSALQLSPFFFFNI